MTDLTSAQVKATLESIKRIKECTSALEELWVVLALGETPIGKRQIAIWLRHDYAHVEEAFYVTSRMLNRQTDPDAVSQERLVKYISKVLTNMQFDGMTPEEREQRLADMRSIAGKMGARKKWQNDKNAICHDLPSDAIGLPSVASACSSDSDSDFDFDSSSQSGCGSPTQSGSSSGVCAEKPLTHLGSQGQHPSPSQTRPVAPDPIPPGLEASKTPVQVVGQDKRAETGEAKNNPKTKTNGIMVPPSSANPPLVATNDGSDCEGCFQSCGYPHHKNCLMVRGSHA